MYNAKEKIIEEFKKSTEKTEFTENECAQWLSNYEAENNEEAKKLLGGNFRSIDSKLDHLSQLHCKLCKGEDIVPIIRIPFSIMPISKQAANPKVRNEFENSIKDYLRKTNQINNYNKNDRLCILIIFVLGEEDRDKDLDNMAKAFLDSIKSILFPDDSQIIHLNLMKVRDTTIKNGEIYVNIRKSNFELNKNVIFELRDYYQIERISLDLNLIK